MKFIFPFLNAELVTIVVVTALIGVMLGGIVVHLWYRRRVFRGHRAAASLNKVELIKPQQSLKDTASRPTTFHIMEPRNRNILRVATWSELNNALFEDTYNTRTHRYKSRYAYRGVSTSTYKLETSLMRLGGDYAYVEPHLLRQFKKYSHDFVKDRDSEWYWLSVAQHYGLPTRLLDWSYSPQVALHFATSNTDKFDRDGAVFMVNYQKAHENLPKAMRKIVEDSKTWILTTEILGKFASDIEQLKKLAADSHDFVLFYEPPAVDLRLFNQFAYFSMTSRPDLLMDDWLAAHPDLWRKIIFPAEIKWEVRDKLDQNNVSERVLFPGLDGIAAWLKRYYIPTGQAASQKKT